MKIIWTLFFCFISVNAYSSENPKSMQMSCDVYDSVTEGDIIINTKILARFQSERFSPDLRPIFISEELPPPYQEVNISFNYTKVSYGDTGHETSIPSFLTYFDYKNVYYTTNKSVDFDIKDPSEGSTLYLNGGFIFNPERFLSYICSLTFLKP